MLIRSQDKLKLLNINTIIGFEISLLKSGVCKIYASTNNVDLEYVIGEYSTKEKAIKVLDMIQEEYLEPAYVSCFSDMEYAKHEHKVYQMPQEDEVIL